MTILKAGYEGDWVFTRDTCLFITVSLQSDLTKCIGDVGRKVLITVDLLEKV